MFDEFLPVCKAIYKGCDVDAPEWSCFVQDVKPTDTIGAVWFESDYGYSFRVNVLNVKDVKIVQRYAYGLDDA